MFTIESVGFFRTKQRLVAPTELREADFRKVAGEIGCTPFRARKLGFIAARKAERSEEIQTCWGGTETINTALPGDWIATNLSHDRKVLRDAQGHENTYVIKAETFPKLYAAVDGSNEFGQFFKATSIVDALYLSGGFDIQAPWGAKQTANAGYLLLNGDEVYGNHAKTFDTTYEAIQ